jgi:hypothetical protein
MKRLLLLLLLLLPLPADAARLFVRANSDKITPSEGAVPGGGWTVAFWFKLTSAPSASTFEFFADGSGEGNPNPRIYYDDTAGVKTFQCWTSSVHNVWQVSSKTVTFTVAQWYHIAIVASSSPTKLYIDGVDTAWTTNASAGNQTSGGTIRIGCIPWSSDLNFLDGTMGPVARWTTESGAETGALNALEVLALARGVPPEKVRPFPAGGRQYVWPLEGWQTTEPDIGTRHSAPATVTGAVRANNPPTVPR